MSMLAEQRRKTKWVINPTKKPIWSTDSSGIKFGKHLMEKMGWSAGKGLGLNEQGIQEPLKVSFKNDTKGMGFKGNDDDWIEHQDEFNVLLRQLRSNGDSSDMNSPDVEKNEIKSLEEKSKQSKARVHYHKFMRGKDLSRYSENDLACILGIGKTKKKVQKLEEVKNKGSGTFETSFGVTTINSGSINDYFKKKWTVDKIKPISLCFTASETEEELNFRPSFSNTESCFSEHDELFMKPEVEEEESSKKKHKVRPREESLVVQENTEFSFVKTENTEKVDKKKRKAHTLEINLGEPKNKKRRKNSSNNTVHVSENLSPQDENNGKKKKDKSLVMMEIPYDKVESQKEKKRRKQVKRNVEECAIENGVLLEEISDVNNGDNSVEAETITEKKKKKARMEKVEEKVIRDYKSSIETEISNPAASECIKEPIKKKKKKMKLEKKEVIGNSVQYVDSSDHRRYSFSGAENTKESSDTQSESMLEMVKKKKEKKDEKEKVEEFDDTNQEVPCSDMKHAAAAAAAAAINTNRERENTIELESRKKKKKRAKKHKENNHFENEDYNSNQTEHPHLEETSENTNGICEREGTLEVEYEKKKRKKDKKERDKEVIERRNEEPCLGEEKIVDKTSDVDCATKKKKIHKVEKLQSSGGTGQKEPCDMIIREDSCTGNKEVNGTLINNKQESRMQRLRSNLFPDQAAVKYFPGQATNERVLKLIRWANIKEFKGSNLNDLEGYGRRIMYQKQSR